MRSIAKLWAVTAALGVSAFPTAHFATSPAAATETIKVVIRTRTGVGVPSEVMYIRGSTRTKPTSSNTFGLWYAPQDPSFKCDAETQFQITKVASGYIRPTNQLPCNGPRTFFVEPMKVRR